MCQRPVQQRGTVLAAQLMPLLQTSVYPRLQEVSPDPVWPETHTLKAFGCVEIGRSHSRTSDLTPSFCLWRECDVFFIHCHINPHLVERSSTAQPSPFFAFL